MSIRSVKTVNRTIPMATSSTIHPNTLKIEQRLFNAGYLFWFMSELLFEVLLPRLSLASRKSGQVFLNSAGLLVKAQIMP